MELHIALPESGELVGPLFRQLSDAIAEGALRPGERLPATRALAAELGIARNTVAAAYDRLLGEGLVTARVGAGTFVAGPPPAPRRRATRATVLQPSPLLRRLLAEEDDRDGSLAFPAPDGSPIVHDFAVGVPDPAFFPGDDWRREVSHALRPTSPLPGGYGDPAGVPALRAAIARHVRLSRAVRADPDDVIVAAGAQGAIALVARTILSPGDVVAVEEPGYPPIRELLAVLGARVEHVPVDAEGIRVDALSHRTRLISTTPSHQFPLGHPMSRARREQLLAWADEHRAAIVEDDYDSEFRYGGRPLDALHSLDRAGRVVYVGTFSKSLLPGLRLGFAIVPPSLRRAAILVRRTGEHALDPVPQTALAALLESGRFAARARTARRQYELRQRALRAALAEHLEGVLTPLPATAGLHLAALLAPDAAVSARRIRDDAAAAGIRVETLDEYHVRRPERSGLVLGFGRIAAERIPDGVAALAAVIRR